MRLRLPAVIGVVVGVAAGMVVLGYVSMRRHVAGVPMLGDEGGRVRGVVVQYVRGSGAAGVVFREYLGWQTGEVTAYVACPGEADYKEFCGLVGKVKCRLVPVYTGHVQTAWSRDRWVALTDGGTGAVTVLSPKGENAVEGWPGRAGDGRIGEDLGRLVPGEFLARRCDLFFDGGDFLADGGKVFVTRQVVERNVQHTVTTKENLVRVVEGELNLAPVLLEDGPEHHAGMFMMAAGVDPMDGKRRVMVVADPSLGKAFYAGGAEADGAFAGGPDFSAGTQGRFDSVARVCEREGYRVVRVPVVPAVAGKMYMTYVNVILDKAGDGHSVVYMSTFGGQERLNDAGAKAWEALGYEVRRVDCSGVWELGGTVHCLVNVFRRG